MPGERIVDDSAMNEVSDWDKLVAETQYEGARSAEEWKQLYPQMENESKEDYEKRLEDILTNEYVMADDAQKEEHANSAAGKYEQMVNKRVESGDLKPEDAEKMLDKMAERQAAKDAQAAEEAKAAAEAAAEAAQAEAGIAADFDYQQYERNQYAQDILNDLRTKRMQLEDEFSNNMISAEDFDARVKDINAQIMKATEEVNKTGLKYDDIQTRQQFGAEQDAEFQALAEKLKEGDPAADEFLERHPEFKEELVKAAANLGNLAGEGEGADSGESDSEGSDGAGSGEGEGGTGEADAGEGSSESPAEDDDDIIEGNGSEETGEDGELSGTGLGEGPDYKAGEELEDEKREKVAKGLFGFFRRNKAGKDRAVKKSRAKFGRFKRTMALFMAGMVMFNVGSGIAKTAGGDVSARAAAAEQDAGDALRDDLTVGNEGQGSSTDTWHDSLEVSDESEQAAAEEDQSKAEKKSNIVAGHSYGEEMDFDIDMKKYSGESSFLNYNKKHGRHNLTSPLYNMEEAGNKSKAELAQEIVKGLARKLDDPIMQAQFAGFGGSEVDLDGMKDGIGSFKKMNRVLDAAQSDDEFRKSLANYSQDMLRDLVENYDAQVDKVKKGETYSSLYAMNVADDDEAPRLKYFYDDEVTAKENFEVLKFMDEDGKNMLDTNEIGGMKYNFLKAAGIITANMSDKEAKNTMKHIKVLGISGKCGQIIWTDVEPGTGDEDTGSTGNEDGDHSTGNEDGDHSTGNEDGDHSTGNEDGDHSTGNEDGDKSTGNEDGDKSVGNEDGDKSVGNEDGDGSVGNEDGDGSVGNEDGDGSVGNEDTGSVGNEDTGSVGNEDTGSVGNEDTGSTGNEDTIPSKTDHVPDSGHDQILGETVVEDNNGVVESSEDNDGTKHEAGSEVTTQTDKEKESGDAPGSQAITESQGVTTEDGKPLTDATTGGQVVNEDRNGDNTATEDQIKDAENGVASNFTPDDQEETGKQYEGEAEEAENAQHIGQTSGEETGNPESASDNTDLTDEELAEIFNNGN